MWILLSIAILLVLGAVYVGVRQARHPVAPGRHPGADVQLEQRGKFWGSSAGGGY